MIGRIYDPTLGRFLQADPFIQAPSNTQNYNRYSYVLNNPMSYTDPSGYFFKKLFRAIAKVPVLNAAVQIGLGIACGPAAAACISAYSAAQGYALTGSLSAAIKAGAISYATASAFKAIGGKFTGKGGFFDAGVKNGFNHIMSHALVGGVSSVLQGGKFGHGFLSAGITKGLTPQFEGIGKGDFDVAGYDVAEATVAGVLGGTLSKLSGGKFANGAITAAMGNLFNNQGGNKKGTRSNPHGERQPGYTLHQVSDGVWAWIPQSAVPNSYLANETGTTVGNYTTTTEEEVIQAVSVVASIGTLGSGTVFYGSVVTLFGIAVYEPTPANVTNFGLGIGGKFVGPLDDFLYPGATPLANTIDTIGAVSTVTSLVQPPCQVPYRC